MSYTGLNTGTPNYFGSEQQFLVTLSIVASPAGLAFSSTLKNKGKVTFDKFSGGDVQSTINKHRPGGMGPEISFLALPTYSDVTISKAWNTGTDNALWDDLTTIIGNTIAQVTVQPLDDGGNAWGSATVYTGRINKAMPGGTDSNSNSVRMLEVGLSVETVANVGSSTTNNTSAPSGAMNTALWTTTITI
jgi:hypothetical protein